MTKKTLNVLITISTIFLLGCGEPNKPESIYNSGGYQIIAKHTTIAAAQDIAVNGDYCYIAQGEGGLLTVDVQDRKNPHNASYITEDVRGYSRAIVHINNHVFLAAGTFGFTSINISNPEMPVVSASNINMKPAKEAFIINNYMFTAISEQGIQIAEVTESGLPDIRGKTTTQGYANGITVNSDMSLMFVACGEMGLSIYDISDFQDGYGIYPKVGWIDTYDYAQAVALDEESKLALVASSAGGLVIVDYSDLSNVTIAGTFHTDDDAHDVKFADNLAYVSANDGGFYVVNIDNPAQPISIAHLGFSNALGFDMDNDYIYVADEDEGLVIIAKP